MVRILSQEQTYSFCQICSGDNISNFFPCQTLLKRSLKAKPFFVGSGWRWIVRNAKTCLGANPFLTYHDIKWIWSCHANVTIALSKKVKKTCQRHNLSRIPIWKGIWFWSDNVWIHAKLWWHEIEVGQEWSSQSLPKIWQHEFELEIGKVNLAEK